MTQFSLAELYGMTIRESANDGSDFTNPSADYRRLFLGEDGLLHVKDSAGAVTSPYSSSVIGSASFVGYNTVGGSFINMNGTYAKKVTLSATSLIVNIGAHVKGNATNAFGLSCAIMTDGGTVPANVIARAGAGYDSGLTEVTKTGVMNTTARWIEMPINAYLTAADYWICVIGGNGGTGLQLAKDGSGTDATVGNFYPMDHSVANFTAGTDKHSIRALILS